jgi:hypothetical protein
MAKCKDPDAFEWFARQLREHGTDVLLFAGPRAIDLWAWLWRQESERLRAQKGGGQ